MLTDSLIQKASVGLPDGEVVEWYAALETAPYVQEEYLGVSFDNEFYKLTLYSTGSFELEQKMSDGWFRIYPYGKED